MMCGQCGLTWDMNDPEPPECPRVLRAVLEVATNITLPHYDLPRSRDVELWADREADRLAEGTDAEQRVAEAVRRALATADEQIRVHDTPTERVA